MERIKLHELKEWLFELPEEFDDYELITAELIEIEDNEEMELTNMSYTMEKPVRIFAVNELTKEIMFVNDPPNKLIEQN